MEIFWNTIAAYNAATWPAQIGFTLVAAMLLVLLYLRPTPAVRIAMKLFMAFLNFWIAGVYYMIYCRPREYHGMLALFWAIMGGIWIYELLVKHASLERTGQHNAFAILLLVMPLIYPLCSLALGHEFPIMTSRYCTSLTYSLESSDLYAHAQTNILPLQWTRADKPAHHSI